MMSSCCCVSCAAAAMPPRALRVDTAGDFARGPREPLGCHTLGLQHAPIAVCLSPLISLRERGLDVPFIIVSGTIGEETAVRAMKAGRS